MQSASFCNIIHNYSCSCVPKIHGRNCSELLCSRCVPQLQLHFANWFILLLITVVGRRHGQCNFFQFYGIQPLLIIKSSTLINKRGLRLQEDFSAKLNVFSCKVSRNGWLRVFWKGASLDPFKNGWFADGDFTADNDFIAFVSHDLI